MGAKKTKDLKRHTRERSSPITYIKNRKELLSGVTEEEGNLREVAFDLSGFNVIALNVTKLNEDIREPKNYLTRVEEWRSKVEKAGGTWKRINEMDHIDQIFND